MVELILLMPITQINDQDINLVIHLIDALELKGFEFEKKKFRPKDSNDSYYGDL